MADWADLFAEDHKWGNREEAIHKGFIHRTAKEAEQLGYIVNRETYPWTGYKGDLFNPDEVIKLYTPPWPR